MTHDDIGNALMILRPKAQWIFSDADLSTLVWLDKTQTRPTDQEILAQIAQ